MEDQARNHLEALLQHWRRQCEAQETFSASQIEELEAHLRDSAQSLVSAGLTDDEAFLIATQRLGQPTALAQQFQTNGGSAWWTRRLLWMLGGVVAYHALTTTQGFLVIATLFFLEASHSPTTLLFCFARIGAILGSTVVLWLVLRQEGKIGRRVFQKIPAEWWLALMLLVTSVRPIALMIDLLPHHHPAGYLWEIAAQMVGELWFIGLTVLFFVVWRKSRTEISPEAQQLGS